MAKGKVLQTIIDISGEISPTLGKTIDTVNKKLNGVDSAALKAKLAVAAIGTVAATAAVSATKYLTGLGDDYNKAVNDIAASTGFAGEQLGDLSEIMTDIYGANLGDNLGDVADGLGIAQRNTGLMGKELEDVTKGAFALRDTFEYDIAESTRAAKALMMNFGISGEKAMGLIAKGAQNGLDYSGEMIDTINEYSVQFAKVGLDAEDMFSIMQSGADGTAWNLDKVGDAVKEFSIRSIDGSKTTIAGFKAIGVDADEMMQTFAKGGDAANEAFYDILDGLLAIEDPVARDAAGVNLFGTQWEDLGVEAVRALADTRNATYDTTGVLENLNAVKYNNIDDAIRGVKRTIETSLMPAGDALSDKFMELAPKIQSMVEKAAPHLENLALKFGDILAGVIDFMSTGIGPLMEKVDAFMPLIAGLTGAFVAYKAITLGVTIAEGIKTAVMATGAATMSAATVATWALNSAMAVLTSPIFLVVAAIGAVIAIGVLLYKNWDTIKEKAAQLGEFLGTAWENMKLKVGEFIEGIKATFKAGFEALVGFVTAPIQKIQDKLNGIKDKIKGVFGGSGSTKDITLPAFAAGGFTRGLSLAGEAGTEAVISFDPTYRSQNLSYWARAGQMLGATSDDAGFALSGSGGDTVIDFGGVNFAPNITVSGNADKQSIMDAIEAEYPEFLDLLDRWIFERGMTIYAN